jgi:Tfp pilus assembly ATPase PilU
MQTNTTRGMQTMEQALAELTIRRVVTDAAAMDVTSRPEEFKSLLERAGFQGSGDDNLAPLLHELRVAQG